MHSHYVQAMQHAILAKQLKREARWCRHHGYIRMMLDCYTKAAYLIVEAHALWRLQ